MAKFRKNAFFFTFFSKKIWRFAENVLSLHRLFKNNAICNREKHRQKCTDNSKRLQNGCKDNTNF